MAEEVYNTSPRSWTTIAQSTSYRATTGQVDFFNNQLLGPSDNRLIAVRKGERPRYLICDSYSHRPLEELKHYLKVLDPADILVVAPSIYSPRSPIRQLANEVALNYPNIHCHIPLDEENNLPKELLKGKLLFCTYHQAKGIEREAVIMFCFDTSYHKFYNRDGDKTRSSNAQYVGATRGRQYLTLIHDKSHDYLQFLDRKTLPYYCDKVGDKEPSPITVKEYEENQKPRRYTVTDLTKHLSDAVTSYCFHSLDLELESPSGKQRLYVPTTVHLEKDVQEAVADITGTALTAILEHRWQGKCSLLAHVQKLLNEHTSDDHPSTETEHDPREHPFRRLPVALREKLLNLSPETMILSDFLLVANAANAATSGYLYKLLKIKDYNWLNQKHVDIAESIIRHKDISRRAIFERLIRRSVSLTDNHNVKIYGQIDVIDDRTVWELKWTDELKPKHVLQLACYAAMFPERVYKLLHVPTGKVVVVRPKGQGFQNVLEKLVMVKTEGNGSLGLTDEAFKKELHGERFERFIDDSVVPSWLSGGGPIRTSNGENFGKRRRSEYNNGNAETTGGNDDKDDHE